jgi:hypoxanthine phosphoribosyltransferase
VENRIVTYNDYDHMLDKMVNYIEGHAIHGELDFVYGPKRGGLPIAVHMSHHLDLKYLDKGLLHELNKDELERVLFVDDIADTGKTLKDIGIWLGFKPITAVLFVKDRSVITPDYWVETCNDWVTFPWEKFDEKPNRPEVQYPYGIEKTRG